MVPGPTPVRPRLPAPLEAGTTDEDLTRGSLARHIRRIAVPASIGYFFNTMYNAVDTYFAGILSTEALAALSISFPVFFILIAMGTGLGTGSTALIANALGEGDRVKAMAYTAQSLTFALLTGLFLTLTGLIASPFLFRALGAEGSYLATALRYMDVIIYGSVFFMIAYVVNSSLNAQGDTASFRNFLVAGFFLNILLDPWFMFGGFGFPALGIAGVGWATVVIQIGGCVYLFYRAIRSGLLCRQCLAMLSPQFGYFADIFRQGFPASLNMMTVVIGAFVITYYVSAFGKEAVAAYGTALRIEQIALLPVIGLNMATLALVGQNNGAGLMDRVRETLATSLKYGLWVMAVGALMVFIAADPMMRLFTGDGAVIRAGVTYLRIAAFISWAYIILYTSVSALQGMKRPFFAVYIGLARQVIVPVAVFSLMQYSGVGLLGIWWGIFGITWAAALVALFYTGRVVNARWSAPVR